LRGVAAEHGHDSRAPPHGDRASAPNPTRRSNLMVQYHAHDFDHAILAEAVRDEIQRQPIESLLAEDCHQKCWDSFQ
jgi:hypothetical protein